MKITAVKHFALHANFRNIFLVKIETDAGIYGIGEGGIAGRERAMAGMIDHYEPILVGQDPRRIEDIWQMLYRRQYFEGGTIMAAAISAIDIALWDILGKSLGVPVYQLLGGRSRNWVPCFTDGGILNDDACVEKAQQLVADGWEVLRFVPGMPGMTSALDDAEYDPWISLDLAAQWLSKIREVVGSQIRLAIDFHHRLSVAEAADFCRRVEPLGLMFVEEPIRSENPDAYAALRRLTSIPFAIGEEFSSKWAFRPFVEQGLCNYARVDVCNVGGFTEAKKVAGWCETHYIDMMPHNPLGVVCMAASAHFATAINNFAYQEHNTTSHGFPTDLFPVHPKIEPGRIIIDDTPGIGVEFNDAAAGDYPFENWEAPRYDRPDGAFTNW